MAIIPKRSLAISAVVLLAGGCGGTAFVNTEDLPESYQCSHMKEVCKEAREFERAYSKLSADEKKDAENVLTAYRLQCNEALEQCKKSAPKK